MRCQPVDLSWLSASAHVSAANTLTMLIKASDYKRHCRTRFFLPETISLFIMCIEIIRYSSCEGWHHGAEAWTTATKCVTLYCTWCTSALTTGPVVELSESFQGGLMASARREPIMGVWGQCPQRGPGAEPLVRGAKPPWSWKPFTVQQRPTDVEIWPF